MCGSQLKVFLNIAYKTFYPNNDMTNALSPLSRVSLLRFWNLEMDFDEDYPIVCDSVDPMLIGSVYDVPKGMSIWLSLSNVDLTSF